MTCGVAGGSRYTPETGRELLKTPSPPLPLPTSGRRTRSRPGGGWPSWGCAPRETWVGRPRFVPWLARRPLRCPRPPCPPRVIRLSILGQGGAYGAARACADAAASARAGRAASGRSPRGARLLKSSVCPSRGCMRATPPLDQSMGPWDDPHGRGAWLRLKDRTGYCVKAQQGATHAGSRSLRAASTKAK